MFLCIFLNPWSFRSNELRHKTCISHTLHTSCSWRHFPLPLLLTSIQMILKLRLQLLSTFRFCEYTIAMLLVKHRHALTTSGQKKTSIFNSTTHQLSFRLETYQWTGQALHLRSRAKCFPKKNGRPCEDWISCFDLSFGSVVCVCAFLRLHHSL